MKAPMKSALKPHFPVLSEVASRRGSQSPSSVTIRMGVDLEQRKRFGDVVALRTEAGVRVNS